MPAPRLVIATSNPDKVSELRELLGDTGWEVVAPGDIGISIEVEETGSTYAENARLKAEAFSRASGLAALADDSGLEVDALDGEPGALHHVNGWDGRDQAERIQILLTAMLEVPRSRRKARFRAVTILVLPDGRVFEEEGTCEGAIATAPAGEHGFGYDPVFVPALPEALDGRGAGRTGVTMAELSPEQKNAVSHRGIAARRMAGQLRELAGAVSG
jgi:XTP/dITP diphosphohydrolase